MKHTSIVVNNPVELLELTPVNPLISRCQIKVCYVGDTPNRNGSIITKDVAKEMANTLPGSPIVGFYNTASGDFEEHNRRIEIVGGELRFEDTTRPYGFVDLNAKVWFQDFLDDGVVHTYLVTEGWLWTGQYPECKRVIERGNNQSMELDENNLDGSWTIDDKSGMEFFIINEAVISKLCILGEDFEPCFEGASITHFSLNEEFNQKIYALMKEVKQLKGGYSLMDNEEVLLQEEEEEVAAGASEEVEQENVETTFAAAEETQTEEVVEEEILENQDESVTFSLEDFQNLQNELDSLKNQYADLESRYNELEVKYNETEENYNSMKVDFDALTEFKERKDREEKQNMIDSFYMLSDEEKKEVQENIDKYSVEEIESKLSVICVHNKLDLSDKKEEEVTDTTYSLNNNEEEEFSAPAWVSLLRKMKNN